MTEREARYLETLERRAERLARYARLARERNVYIPHVMGLTGELVIRTLMGLCGEEISKHFFHYLDQCLRRGAGICTLCDNVTSTVDRDICDNCWQEGQEMDRELDQLLDRAKGDH